MNQSKTTLRLNRETVRDLSARHLGNVAGGTSGDVCTIENATTAFITPATGVATAADKAVNDAINTVYNIASAEVGGCPSNLCFTVVYNRTR
ncbi:MAG TPA: hypothetical protein VG245_06435 [Candidatus Dormibacteraeota bacterium]|jgi:hypothetical protein|nr:hypothetical protein [Candidatus Dormibacteraeota bacterium]